MTRTTKQSIYGTVYIAIIVGIGLLVYFAFIRPAPGCFNGRQDTGEEGVDCGNVCGNVCLPFDLKPIKVQSIQLFSPLSGKLSILAKLQNPNPTLASRDFIYELQLMGNGSSVLKTVTERGYIYAGEVKYIAEFIDGYDTKSVAKVNMSVKDVTWTKDENFRKPDFSVQDRHLDIATTTVTVSGRLVHKDTVDMPKVTLVAIFNAAGVIGRTIGVSATELDDVATGDSRPFDIIHPRISGIDPARTEIIVSARRP